MNVLDAELRGSWLRRMRRTAVHLIPLALLSSVEVAHQASPGDLDPAFGTGGHVTSNLGGNESAQAVLV
jgi:hypothetical protein